MNSERMTSILKPLSEAKTGFRIAGGAVQTVRYYQTILTSRFAIAG
jgi:hypothetical protein